MNKISSRRPYLFTIGITGVILILFIVFRSYLTGGLMFITSLIRSPFDWTLERGQTIYSAFTYFEDLSAENAILKEKNIKLIQENQELEKYRTENQQLKNQLNYRSLDNQVNLITARIYAADPLNLSDSIIIDKGTIDDVNQNDHIIYNGMYLGKIISVTEHTATVELITDPRLKIVGQIQEAEVTGIIHGQIGYGLIIEEIPPNAQLRVGQTVTTADIDPQLPSDLLIGEITEIFHEDQNIFQSASVKPYFNIRDIKYVLVQSNHEINS